MNMNYFIISHPIFLLLVCLPEPNFSSPVERCVGTGWGKVKLFLPIFQAIPNSYFNHQVVHSFQVFERQYLWNEAINHIAFFSPTNVVLGGN